MRLQKVDEVLAWHGLCGAGAVNTEPRYGGEDKSPTRVRQSAKQGHRSVGGRPFGHELRVHGVPDEYDSSTRALEQAKTTPRD